MTPNLSHVILSLPSLVLATTTDADGAPRSWIQLARTGSFQSSRYGLFDIKTDDLRMMAKNFRPGTTPIDYDHLSNDPKRPGDGIAAGWLQRVELRDGGNTLWGLVEWTPDAAKYIADGAYRFTSPSFMRDAHDAFGNELGTKLIAVALTNLPFLPEMSAITLGDEEVFGAFALSLPAGKAPATRAISLAEIGQRVGFQPDPEKSPELSDEERGATFLVKSSIGAGDAEFVRLTRLDGTEFGWFRAEAQLAPARAVPERTQEDPNMMQNTKTTETDIEQQAAQFSARVAQHFKNTGDWTKAFSLAQHEDATGAAAYRLTGIGAEPGTDTPAPISLSVRTGESFDDLVSRYAAERRVPLRVAAHEVGRARPDLAAARG